MSKPVFEDVFAFSGRRNRKSFFLFVLFSFIGITLVVSAMMAIYIFLFPVQPGQSPPVIFSILGTIVSIPLMVASVAVAAQRCRDFGWTGWAVLISMIPVVGFIFNMALVFVPGTKGPNRYGPDPRAT